MKFTVDIPESHPRYESLRLRELIAEGYENGLVDRTGLIAHGRGEAFDYLLGEQSHKEALSAAKTAAALLKSARNPVISVNGNTAVLVPEEIVKLSKLVPAKIEVNIFHSSNERLENLIAFLERHGAKNVLGRNPDAELPNLAQPRGRCTKEGIFESDVILVPLEDGDRAEVLAKMKKRVIIIDLNPLSRSSQNGTVTIVDNITRAMRNIIKHVENLNENTAESEIQEIISGFDNTNNLNSMINYLQVENIKKYI